MNGHPDGTQLPPPSHLRGGDGASMSPHQQSMSPYLSGSKLITAVNTNGQPLVPFNTHQTTDIVDLPRHHPQEIILMVQKIDEVATREKEFPIILHKHRTNIDKVTLETSKNYNELMDLIRGEIEKTNDATLMEILSLLKGEFDSLMLMATTSEATMSNHFADYKDLLYDQFGKVLSLERANLHNSLAIWRDRYDFDQQMILSKQVKMTQDMANSRNDLIANLQAQHSKISMRIGMVLAEKKEAENQARHRQEQIDGLQSTQDNQLTVTRDRVQALEEEKKDHNAIVLAKQAMIDAQMSAMNKQKADFDEDKKDYGAIIIAKQATVDAQRSAIDKWKANFDACKIEFEKTKELLKKADAKAHVAGMKLEDEVAAREHDHFDHVSTVRKLQEQVNTEVLAQQSKSFNDAQTIRKIKEALDACQKKLEACEQQLEDSKADVLALMEGYNSLEQEHQKCAEHVNDAHTVRELQVALAASEQNLEESKADVLTLMEGYSSLEKEHQQCAEQAEKVKNLPDIWDLRTEVARLKQDNARLLKKNVDLKSNRIESFECQIADDFANIHAIEACNDGRVPISSRWEEEDLKAECAASNALITQLNLKVDLLEEKNAALEDSLQKSQSISADAKAAEQPDEVAQFKELVDLLDLQNASIKEELGEYKNDPLDGRVTRLQGQLEIYKKLLTSDRFEPAKSLNLLAGTQMQKLVKSGLHRHNPARSFVSETYYTYSEIVKQRMEQKVLQNAVKPASAFAFDTPGEDEIIWDDE